MRFRIWTTLFLVTIAQFAGGQTSGVSAEATAPEPSANSYTVLRATPEQEALVRAQIRVMQPDVYPLRVLFVPHWKYIDTATIFHLHVPAGYTSAMFAHLPSRSVFIDSDRYVSDDSLGYWVAHELGHLAGNSASEKDADKAAREYRKRLKEPEPALTITVRLYNYAQASPAILTVAKREASTILDAAGLHAAWVGCLEEPVSVESTELCQKGWTADTPSIRILSGPLTS